MKPLSKEVKQRRWKIIGHILRQDRRNDCNTAMTWTPEGKRKKGRPKMTWRRTEERERGERNRLEKARATVANRERSGRTVEREREERNRLAVMGRGKSYCSQQREVEAFCGDLMRHDTYRR